MSEINTEPENEMSFLDHLEVLRWHLVRMSIAIVVTALAAFIYKEIIFDGIIFGPKKPDFITYRFFCAMSDKLSALLPSMFPEGSICIGQNLPSLVNLTMAGQFSAHIITSIISGIVIAFPYLVWEVWRFIKPGLHPREQKQAKGFVFSITFLFLCGVAFGYYVITPLSVNFFMSYQVSTDVLNNPTLETYISLITTIVLACGAIFELPVVVYFLTRIGLLSPKVLKAFRRHAIVGALTLAAIITPPDVFSQILVTIPILLLYEISIWISAIVIKNGAR